MLIMMVKETVFKPKPFKALISLKQVSSDKEGQILMEGLASTSNRSRTGHRMLKSAIQMMKDAAIDLPIFLSHDPNQVVGRIIEVKQSSDEEFVPIFEVFGLSGNDIVDAPVHKVLHWLKNGLELGLSIGGNITQAKLVETDNGEIGWDIETIDLIETSITPIPAVSETKGKTKILKCDICAQIGQSLPLDEFDDNMVNLEVDDMVKEDVNVEEKLDTIQSAMELLLDERKARLEEEKKVKQSELEALREKELMEKVEQFSKAAAEEAAKKVLDGIRQDRGQTKTVTGSVNKDEVTEKVKAPLTQNVVGQTFNNPLEYPTHVAGIKQVGYTPDELAQRL